MSSSLPSNEMADRCPCGAPKCPGRIVCVDCLEEQLRKVTKPPPPRPVKGTGEATENSGFQNRWQGVDE